jgi:excisionase family DNA binding protein
MNDRKELTISIEEAAIKLGIGRALAYRLATQNKFPGLIKLGHRYRISTIAIEQVLKEGWEYNQ